jgi:hypothetical protein
VALTTSPIRHLQANTVVHWATWMGCTIGLGAISFILSETIPTEDKGNSAETDGASHPSGPMNNSVGLQMTRFTQDYSYLQLSGCPDWVRLLRPSSHVSSRFLVAAQQW